MSELVQCPFCGVVESLETGEWQVGCHNCGARGPIAHGEAHATATWNRRAPAAEPTAGDAKKAARRLLTMLESPYVSADMNDERYQRNVAAIEAALLAQRQARPSLGAAADGEERERCVNIVQDRINLIERVERARAGKDPNGNASAARRLSLRNLRDCLFAIRASSPEGSPDGSPEGEGGGET